MVYIHFLSCITFEYCFKWLLFSCIRFSIRSKVLFLLFVHKHIHVWNDNLFIHTTLYLFIFSLYNQPLLSEKKAQSEEEVIKNRTKKTLKRQCCQNHSTVQELPRGVILTEMTERSQYSYTCTSLFLGPPVLGQIQLGFLRILSSCIWKDSARKFNFQVLRDHLGWTFPLPKQVY